MATQVCIPLLSMDMSEGTIKEWFVPDGGMAKEGEMLYAIESEKSVVEVPSPASGVLRHKVAVGETLPVGAEIAEIS